MGECLCFDLFVGGNFLFVNILVIIGLIILIMVSFNYINLFIVVGIIRVREIGVKKILGVVICLL